MKKPNEALDMLAMSIVYSAGAKLHDKLPQSVSKNMVDARQATNDQLIDEAKAKIQAWALQEFEGLLPEKLPTEAHEKWMGKGHLVALDKGFNLAIDYTRKAARKRFGRG